jgi:hypothetical protein
VASLSRTCTRTPVSLLCKHVTLFIAIVTMFLMNNINILSWLSRLKTRTFCGQAKEEIFKEVHVTGSDNDCKVLGVRLILSPKVRSPIAAIRTTRVCGQAKEEIFKEVHVTSSDNDCKVLGVRLILSPKGRSPMFLMNNINILSWLSRLKNKNFLQPSKRRNLQRSSCHSCALQLQQHAS